MNLADNARTKRRVIMGKKKAEHQEQPTIWETPDGVWPLIQTILDEHYPAKRKGHRRADLRRVLNGIIFRLRTGCQWNQFPARFVDNSTVHRHFQQWCQHGLLASFWAALVETCDALGGVDWQWQAADADMGKARRGGDLVGRNPTDRGKKG
jgi:putative transposase